MANERDKVLLMDPNDSEFSGFGPEDVELRSGSNASNSAPVLSNISTNDNISNKKEKRGKKAVKSSTSVTAKGW